MVQSERLAVVFVVDTKEQLAYLPQGLFSSVSDEQVLCQAKRNLERQLMPLPWIELDFDSQVHGLRVLALIDHFYAAEAILSAEKMKEAQAKLNARQLLVSAPIRGQICVVAYTDPNDPPIKVFMKACLDRYLNAGKGNEDNPLSRSFWVVKDGVIQDEVATALVDEICTQLLEPEASPEPLKIYTPAQIGVGSFFGSALAGFYMLSANYRSYGQSRSAIYSWIFAALVVSLTIYLFASLPDTPVDSWFAAVSGLFMGFTAYVLQGRTISSDINQKRAVRKGLWQVVSVVLVNLFIMLLIITTLFMTGLIER